MSKSQPDQLDQAIEIDEPIVGLVITSRTFHRDHRGWLLELFRSDELDAGLLPQMAYISETLPGVTRGPHEHVEQTDYFAFIGPGNFLFFAWDARPASPTHGNRIVRLVGESNPVTMIVPPGVVHAYKNSSKHAGHVFNAPNRLFAGVGKVGPIDEIRHENRIDSPFIVP